MEDVWQEVIDQGCAAGESQWAAPGSPGPWTTALPALLLCQKLPCCLGHIVTERQRWERLSESPGAAFVQLQTMLTMISF